ncbi:MAG: S8 family serine peptidase [Thermodesulfovibrionales bacterium]|nr:S8 family serine peptidase [Thermodesulfovibrionales bacterium]
MDKPQFKCNNLIINIINLKKGATMKKRYYILLFSVILLALMCMPTYAGQLDIHGADQATDHAIAPETAPVIGEDSKLTLPYYVLSDKPALKKQLGVRHEFPKAFSTDLTRGQVQLLNTLGVKTEPVQLYQIKGKPVCGDGVCQGNEPTTCPKDCQAPPPPAISCYPSNQKPWGVIKVNGGYGGSGVKVAILDTGVDTDHPDLAINIIGCVTKVTHFKADAKNCEDANGHGTHVAGTVLANAGSDGLGIYGVAPEASLIAVKVCDRRGFEHVPLSC